jgi:hypothetical protein
LISRQIYGILKEKPKGGDLMNENQNVPYLMHEADMARMERANKRLWILLIILACMLVGTNAAWIVYEAQYQAVEVSQEVDTGEGDTFVAGYGDVNYGESQADSQDASEEGR